MAAVSGSSTGQPQRHFSARALLVLDAGNGRPVKVGITVRAGIAWLPWHADRGQPGKWRVRRSARPGRRRQFDRIWIATRRQTGGPGRQDRQQGGWVQIPLPAGANQARRGDLRLYQDVVMDGRREIRGRSGIEEDLATVVVDLSAGSWIGPTFVTRVGRQPRCRRRPRVTRCCFEPDGDGFSAGGQPARQSTG